MRIFEPLQELKFLDGDRLIGMYIPGLRYNCEDGTALSNLLDRWLAENLVKLIEQYESERSAYVSGQGEVR
jgi:hypothetical protein